MPDLFRDFTPKELKSFAVGELEASEKKTPEHFKPSDRMSEGYQYLSGEIQDKSKLYYSSYCNELYDAWKGWAPKFCSRPPSFLVRPGSPADQPLASASQDLFRYRVSRFDYQQMILQCCQDAVILGIAYARHEWDAERGLCVTKRFKPQNVFWQSTAKTVPTAEHVIEKHVLPRWKFERRFGKEVSDEIPAADTKDAGSYWPADDKWLTEDGKGPLDPIEYYLLWSVHGDYRRLYAFHKDWAEDYLQPASRDAGENVGEEWPFDFDEGEWHLTPLVPTILNDRIEGIATWEVVRGQYLMYQNVLGAVVKNALQVCKKPIVHPARLKSQMRQIEATGETFFSVAYDDELLNEYQGRKIQDLVEVLDLGTVSPDLLNLMTSLQQRFQQLMGVNAVAAINPGGVETAAEATKLADAAANRVADDQGAVERFVNKIGRKEQTADLMRVPAKSVVCWHLPAKGGGGDEDEEPEGETPDFDEAEPNYLRNVPYADAILLEKGPASDRAALQMEALREEAKNKAHVQQMMGGQVDPQEAEQQIPVTPEVQVRRQYGVPVMADVEIKIPGVEQFISEESAAAWPQRAMTRREVERMFQVSIEQGTSSSNGRMQNVQEAGMTAKLLLPEFEKLQLPKQYAAMLNQITRAPERNGLNDAIVTEQDVSQAWQQQQQAAAAQAQAEAQAKQPAGDDPQVVQMQTQAELAKAQASSKASDAKVQSQQLKNEGDAVRERTRNEAQLQMAAINRANANGVV